MPAFCCNCLALLPNGDFLLFLPKIFSSHTIITKAFQPLQQY